jgi:hypothetical protein
MSAIDDLEAKQTPIGRFFSRRNLSREEIDDLTQDVLYHAVKYAHTLKKPASVDSWIYGICRNCPTGFNCYIVCTMWSVTRSKTLAESLECRREV